MGFCLSCLRLQPDESDASERVPLTGGEQFSEASEEQGGRSKRSSKEQQEKRSAAYYQSIIDDANSKFISSSYRHYNGNDSGVEELRLKLAQITVDPALLSSPPFSTLRRAAASSSSNGSSSLQQQIIVDVLSEPANVSQVEDVIDEIAELVRSHAFACRIEEGEASSVVAKFKPFAQSSAD